MKNKKLVVLGIIVAALALMGISGKILAGPPRPEREREINVQEEIAVADTVRSGFSYQGHLTDKTGNPLDGQYDMVFQFWDAAASGSQVGSDIALSNVDVDNGLFNVTIDVPNEFFNGAAFWLRAKVGDEWLEPRREILPVPYALSLWPGADVIGSSSLNYSIIAAINEGDGNGIAAWTWSDDDTFSAAGVYGHSTYTNTLGVLGESEYGNGVMGKITNLSNTNSAVVGLNQGGGKGVAGYSDNDSGVYGSTQGDSVFADAGVRGYSFYTDTLGVLGESVYGNGVMGKITNSSNTNSAVVGWNQGGGKGIAGYSDNSYGVYGDGATYGVVAPDGMLAPTFDVGSPDVAEYFPVVVSGLEPGDVVSIAPDTDGGFGLHRATQAYDTSVAGIVSTEPGVTLGVRDGNIMPGNNEEEVPLALVGRVPCKVDASYGAIAIGDLLTTSPTPGHAMRCDDYLACIGSIVGKALQSLEDGTGVILVLVTLQ
ncbi:MAG: hypothetical protein DRP09_20745 [Candidatus Thorarchaeota archaeon]|nr:MAG: hypothetical protein DRP09_20745 [Candidatus Thorarchaeota archaeon]